MFNKIYFFYYAVLHKKIQEENCKEIEKEKYMISNQHIEIITKLEQMKLTSQRGEYKQVGEHIRSKDIIIMNFKKIV